MTADVMFCRVFRFGFIQEFRGRPEGCLLEVLLERHTKWAHGDNGSLTE